MTILRDQQTLCVHPAHGSDGEEGWPRPCTHQCLEHDKRSVPIDIHFVSAEGDVVAVHDALLKRFSRDGGDISREPLPPIGQTLMNGVADDFLHRVSIRWLTIATPYGYSEGHSSVPIRQQPGMIALAALAGAKGGTSFESGANAGRKPRTMSPEARALIGAAQKKALGCTKAGSREGSGTGESRRRNEEEVYDGVR